MRWLKSLGFLSLWLGLQFISLPAIAETRSIHSDLQRDNKRRCPRDIANKIDSIIKSPQFARSNWGILAKTLDSQTILYSLNAHKYFIPASNVKLLTTAVTLLELGDNFRIQTPIYSMGNAPNLTWLRVQGRGDPTISAESFSNLIALLKQKGVKQIEQLIVDDSYFDRPTINPTWEWFDIYSYYATSVSSLIFNHNSVTLTLLPQKLGQPVKLVWSDAIAAKQWQVENNVVTAPKNTPYDVEIEGVLGQPLLKLDGALAINHRQDKWDLAVADPANYFLESLRHLLLSEGITVTRGFVIDEVPVEPSETKLTTIVSPPLPKLLAEINQESNNLYAETLLKILAKKLDIDDLDRVVETVLSRSGINSQSYSLVDASGLSRHNLITPEALVQTLVLMASTSEFESYLNSLAIAGVNGTLKGRLIDNNLRGNLSAKTGTLSGIASLSGYLNSPGGDTLTFSIIVNNSDLPSRKLRQAIDRIVLLLGQCYGNSI